MGWPLSQDYNEAIQNPASCLLDESLRQSRPTLNVLGIPLPCSGNFADVYELTCPDGTRWALKCFTRAVPDLHQRYAALSQHLRVTALPFTVEFTFLPQGIRLAGSCYPVLKMRWVEGRLLNEFIRDSLDRPAALESLWQIWLRLGRRLRNAAIAHGDLQHGNVLLVAGRKQGSLAVKLVDYDGLWVPALAHRPSGEVGHASYQHPQRLQRDGYGPDMDRFALLLIATALRAVIVGGRPLWQRYDNEDNLLFRATDLAAPRQSALFAELARIPDPLLERLVEGLWQACHGPLEEVPSLEEVLDESRPLCVLPGAVHATTPTAAVESVPIPSGPLPVRSPPEPSLPNARPLPRRRRRTLAAAPARLGMPRWVWIGAGVATLLLWLLVAVVATVARREAPSTPGKPAAVSRAATVAPADFAPSGVPESSPPRAPVAVPAPETLPPRAAETTPPPQMPLPDRPAIFRLLGNGSPLVAVTEKDASVWQLYDWQKQKTLRRFVGHTGTITCFGASQDGRFAATGGKDNRVRVWDLATAQTVGELSSFRPAILVAVAADGTQTVSAHPDQFIVWDIAKHCTHSYGSDMDDAGFAVAIAPDGRSFAVPARDSRQIAPHRSVPTAWRLDERGLYVERLVDLPLAASLRNLPGKITAVVFMPDSRHVLIALANRTVRLWDTEAGKVLWTQTDFSDEVHRLHLSPDSSRVLAESDKWISVLDTATGQIQGSFGLLHDKARACAFDQDASHLILLTIRDGRTHRLKDPLREFLSGQGQAPTSPHPPIARRTPRSYRSGRSATEKTVPGEVA